MTKEQRFAFIENYLRNDGQYATVDILHAVFVDSYIRATEAKFEFMMYGAHKCKQLSRDLSEMFKLGRLNRSATGIQGFASMGFPRWCYLYRLPK